MGIIVMALKTLESKVRYRISRSKDSVFTSKDFLDLSGRDQVGRALRALIAREFLAKIGQGLYVKTRKSSYTGKVILVKPLPDLAKEGLRKVGVSVVMSKALSDYNTGKTTQVPTGRVIAVKGRVSRKIEYNGNKVILEYAS